MEILDNLKENASDFKDNAQKYIDTSLDYYKLKAFKASVEATSVAVRYVIAAFFGAMVLLFFSVAAALAIGKWADEMWVGFASVGAFYIGFTLVLYTLRRQIIGQFVFKKYRQIFYPDADEAKL